MQAYLNFQAGSTKTGNVGKSLWLEKVGLNILSWQNFSRRGEILKDTMNSGLSILILLGVNKSNKLSETKQKEHRYNPETILGL